MRWAKKPRPEEGDAKLCRWFTIFPEVCTKEDGTKEWVWLEFVTRLRAFSYMHGGWTTHKYYSRVDAQNSPQLIKLIEDELRSMRNHHYYRINFTDPRFSVTMEFDDNLGAERPRLTPLKWSNTQ